MVTEAQQPQEAVETVAEIYKAITEAEVRRKAAVSAGIGEVSVSEQERGGIELLSAYLTGGDVPGRFTDHTASIIERLADSVATDPLLKKLIGAWHLEGMVFDWAGNPNGVLGRAIDSAVEVLATYAKGEQE